MKNLKIKYGYIISRPRALAPIALRFGSWISKRVRIPANSCWILPAFLLATPSFGQTWQTVDDFQYVAGQSAGNGALAVLPNGTLLAAGYGYDTAGIGHALVMSSADGGVTWSAPLDDFTSPALGLDPRYLSIGPDSAGNLYAAG